MWSEWARKNESKIKELMLTLSILRRTPLAMLGLGIVLFFILLAVFADVIAPFPPNELDLDRMLLPPNSINLAGTDNLGRDLFSRIAFGARISIPVGLIIVVIGASIGTTLGLVAGYFGGKVQEVIMRVTDMFLAFPYLVFAIALAVILGPSLVHGMIAVSVVWWPMYCRLVNGAAMSVKENEYVLAAELMGERKTKIIIKHILPNILSPLIVQITMNLGDATLTASALSFLGLGAQPPSPEWGAMVAFGRNYLVGQWWLSTIPGVAILLLVLGFNLIGDGLRDALDPTLRRSIRTIYKKEADDVGE